LNCFAEKQEKSLLQKATGFGPTKLVILFIRGLLLHQATLFLQGIQEKHHLL
jgi:hypothetical protein